MSASPTSGPEEPLGDDPTDVRWRVNDGLRRYGQIAARLAHAFGARHGLQASDVQALVTIMEADGRGEPLTPGALRGHLGLSSGGTSYVVDRLERAGHVRRVRDHPSDSRVVHLRHTESGERTGWEFFGPLVTRNAELMARFTPEELEVVARSLHGAATVVDEHLDGLGTSPAP